MLMRKTGVWPLVAAAFWTGCAFGPLGANRVVSPVAVSVDYEGLARLSVSDKGRTAPQSLSSDQAESLWGKLAAENPELADQSAGEEIVIRHIYGEEKPVDFSKMSDLGKIMVLGALVFAVALMAYAFSPMTY